MSEAKIYDRCTCLCCGQAFVCEKPTSVDSSWNRYAFHSYDCKGRRRHPSYEWDKIAVGPLDPVAAQSSWSPYG